jgi:iron complex outermembrane receptor protein
VQDDITLAKDRWRLTLGSKVEHNDFTGYEVQPNVKVLWTPKDKHTGWLSVARAARTPNRGNYDMSFLTIILPPSHVEPFGDLPTAVMYYPNANFRSEYVTAYELGYRVQPTEKTSIDIATFYNDYKDLASQSIGAPTLDMNPVLHILVPCTVANEAYGHTYGGEISTNWQVSNNWRLAGNFSWINLSITNDTITGASTPRTQFHLRSFLNLPKHLELDSLLWHVSDVPAYAAPSYWKLDVRLGWNMSEDRSFSIGANNLFNSRHKEFGSEYAGYGTVATESTQNFYLNATQKF